MLLGKAGVGGIEPPGNVGLARKSAVELLKDRLRFLGTAHPQEREGLACSRLAILGGQAQEAVVKLEALVELIAPGENLCHPEQGGGEIRIGGKDDPELFERRAVILMAAVNVSEASAGV